MYVLMHLVNMLALRLELIYGKLYSCSIYQVKKWNSVATISLEAPVTDFLFGQDLKSIVTASTERKVFLVA